MSKLAIKKNNKCSKMSSFKIIFVQIFTESKTEI